MREHIDFMKAALEEAEKSLAEGGIPIGAVLVRDGEIISRGHNRRIQDDDAMTHAEIDCLRKAGRQSTYQDTILYSTLMPCHLCTGAVIQFKIPEVVIGEARNFSGARKLMEEYGVRLLNLDWPECVALLDKYIKENPEIWNEDIGE